MAAGNALFLAFRRLPDLATQYPASAAATRARKLALAADGAVCLHGRVDAAIGANVASTAGAVSASWFVFPSR